jgi:competence protein ComEC
MGGGHMDFRDRLKKLCGRKANFLYLTHFDADHLNLIRRARSILPELCLAVDIAESVSVRKRRLLETLPRCRRPAPETAPIKTIFTANFVERNDSNMYVVNGRSLVTGDAPAKRERQILGRRELRGVTLYLLGHHGSRTSTSMALLEHLPRLRLAIASAERRIYGHPHRETLHRLRARRISVLLTEEQGTLTFTDSP